MRNDRHRFSCHLSCFKIPAWKKNFKPQWESNPWLLRCRGRSAVTIIGRQVIFILHYSDQIARSSQSPVVPSSGCHTPWWLPQSPVVPSSGCPIPRLPQSPVVPSSGCPNPRLTQSPVVPIPGSPSVSNSVQVIQMITC